MSTKKETSQSMPMRKGMLGWFPAQRRAVLFLLATLGAELVLAINVWNRLDRKSTALFAHLVIHSSSPWI